MASTTKYSREPARPKSLTDSRGPEHTNPDSPLNYVKIHRLGPLERLMVGAVVQMSTPTYIHSLGRHCLTVISGTDIICPGSLWILTVGARGCEFYSR